MKKTALAILMIAYAIKAQAFCGFYVAKADAKLFNKTSQVILVRDGYNSVVTMSSDFRGEINDFAMVVPVPVVLQRSDISVVERVLFDKLDAYSGPRLVEYHDVNPCMQVYDYNLAPMASEAVTDKKSAEGVAAMEESSVRIEAKYTVGEYDILILSAKQSGDLQTWLMENGYKIPKGAREVLEPYIKSDMKFFVVKVNIGEYDKAAAGLLRPLQIRFNSEKFMLPIRLGMANANDEQDMVIYTLTRNGRVETTNYRTVKIPTDKNIPEFVEGVFGKFYVDVFNRTRRREGKNNIYLEYGWNISGNAGVKCDPCPSPPPIMQDLVTAGVNWLQPNGWNGYSGNVYFTRLHVTYNRENFPQDLVFQETQNRENFQCRYIITHPVQGTIDCEQGKLYKYNTRLRREKELQQLASLTGWDVSSYGSYIYDFSGFELPSAPQMRKQHAPTEIQIKTGSTKPVKNTENKATAEVFEPAYKAESVSENKESLVTPAFIILSLIMLLGVINRNKTV